MTDLFRKEATPIMFGAEVFIEPGQTPEEIDLWFLRLQEAGMTVTRIRLFEKYMRLPDGGWDYTLFDIAYKAGEKYGIKIYGNLFPDTVFTDLGGLKFPRDKQHQDAISVYIEHVVTHFRQFSSCYGWVPVNEPGVGHFPQEPFAADKYAEWKLAQSTSNIKGGEYDRFDFADERFHLHYNTWFLQWLTDEIYKHDPDSIIHVNNHAIFKNASEYDFPAWRNFLTSLGGSAHASWHFSYFTREKYALAVNANCEIIRSGAGNIPWFMTELQAGNNTYSGFTALCPTAEEIAQWLWITLGCESKGAIFWCLNPRSSGIEAGEWAMLNYYNQPSDRLAEASKVASVVDQNIDFFEHATEAESGINIIYVRESLWVEKKLQMGGLGNEARDEGGVMKSAIGYFEALCEAGVQANFKEISEFDFSQKDYTGISIILAHQISIPSEYWPLLEGFVQKGGKLIADGLTGYYDENAVATTRLGFPLRLLFGADVLEYKAIDDPQEFTLNERFTLPAFGWLGFLKPINGAPLANISDQVTAVRNALGNGTVWYIPSLIGLGSRIVNDYAGLNAFLMDALELDKLKGTFRFESPQKNMLTKVLAYKDDMVTIIINKSTERKEINLVTPSASLEPDVLFANKGGKIGSGHINIDAEETMVIKWD